MENTDQEYKKLQYYSSSNGITLIALIITIIVLIILSAITINFIMGENGLIQKGVIARNRTNESVKEEENQIADLQNQIEEYTVRATSEIIDIKTDGTEINTGKRINGKTLFQKTLELENADFTPGIGEFAGWGIYELAEDIEEAFIIRDYSYFYASAQAYKVPLHYTIGNQYVFPATAKINNRECFCIHSNISFSNKMYVTIQYTKKS